MSRPIGLVILSMCCMWLCVFVLISRISNYVPDTEPAPATKNNHNRVVPEHHMIAISDTDLETRMLRSRRTVIIQSKKYFQYLKQKRMVTSREGRFCYCLLDTNQFFQVQMQSNAIGNIK